MVWLWEIPLLSLILHNICVKYSSLQAQCNRQLANDYDDDDGDDGDDEKLETFIVDTLQ